VQSRQSLAQAIYSTNVSMAAFVVSDVLVKILGQLYSPIEMIFWRSRIIVAIFGFVLAVAGKLFSKNFITAPVLARCAFDCINSFSFVIAVVHMNLAGLYAILLTSPLLMTILAIIFLKESVGWRRWLAILCGFAGTLLIIKPDTQLFNYWAAVGFLAAFSAALRDLVTTKIHPAISTFEVTFISAIFATGAALLLGVGDSWEPTVTHDVVLLIILAAGWVTGTFLLVHACRVGPIFIVASFRYTLLVWGGIAGYFVFGNLPDIWSLFGAAIIVSCGFYVFYREAARGRAVAARLTVRG
jgi:drug/metabolite transporter (DMT)-like permease